jgi:hypothetical protein
MLSGTARSVQPMIGRAVENQQDVLSGKLARQHVEEHLEACRIRGRHGQILASAITGTDRAIQVDVFADELGGDLCPYRKPTTSDGSLRIG